jgi:hypothetical protein
MVSTARLMAVRIFGAMALEVIGAGAGRTGTQSLKVALERLLGGPCYDMWDLMKNPDHVPVWEQALEGGEVDWEALFSDRRSTVDWTAAAFFAELADAYPEAVVVLSLRDPDDWWRSVRRTVTPAVESEPPPTDTPLAKALAPSRELTVRMLTTRFTPDWTDETATKQAYARHNQAVRDTVPRDRLVEWRPGDGWKPLCAALGLPEPAAPFPHVNTTEHFREVFRLSSSA